MVKTEPQVQMAKYGCGIDQPAEQRHADRDQSYGQQSASMLQGYNNQQHADQRRTHGGEIQQVEALQSLQNAAENAKRKTQRNGVPAISSSHRAVETKSAGIRKMELT